MTTTRRSFLAALPFIPTAVKAVASLPPADIYRCVITPAVETYTLKSKTWTITLPPWPGEFIRSMTEKEYHQCLLADLRRQRPLPLP